MFFSLQPDTLDPALLRPGRIDRKIEIPLPNEVARMEILKIHAGPIAKSGEIGSSRLPLIFFFFFLAESFHSRILTLRSLSRERIYRLRSGGKTF